MGRAVMSGPSGPRERRAANAARLRYRFFDVVVDIGAHIVTRAGRVQPLEPKAFAVLSMLLEQPGQLAARERLLDRVWGHRHVTPGVLTRVIAQVRHALGDDPHQPHLIATHHGLGYRLIAPVQCEARDAVPLAIAPPVSHGANRRERRARPARRERRGASDDRRAEQPRRRASPDGPTSATPAPRRTHPDRHAAR